jgi:hypothetical protein
MIVLTLIESSEEYVSGFPEYLELSSSTPATIYYTLDGSTPSAGSLIVAGRVYLPTVSGSITFKALAVSATDSSDVLEAEYKTDSTTLDGPRRIEEGILVLPYGDSPVDNLSVKLDGSAAQTTSESFTDLDIKASRVASDGVSIEGGKTSVPFINFSQRIGYSDRFSSSGVNDNHYFDPSAKYILIDGSTEAALENQVVRIINRTYNSLDTTSPFYKEHIGRSEPIITGNYVRSYYNKKTGKYISYYWESLESRWLVSIQSVEPFTRSAGSAYSKNKFVFRWIQDRSTSSIF